MFSIENHVGRLVEVRVASPVEEENMPSVARSTRTLLEGLGRKFVAVMDLRQAHVFPRAVSEGFVHVLTDNNPLLERSAFLIGESAIFALQVERAIREAGNPRRHAFRKVEDLEAWLDEVLDREEQERLHAFLTVGAELPA